MALLTFSDKGFYCPPGDFYIDPWRQVSKAVITHAHSDHARSGHRQYIAQQDSIPLLKLRLGSFIQATGYPYGVPFTIRGVRVSFHPAAHVLGSAQVRLEYKGEVWVVTGDYKLARDPLAGTFEPVPCHTFITECTFGLPIYQWPEPGEVFAGINQWWRQNKEEGRTSILSAYSLGKAQRILCSVDAGIGPIYTHGAIENTHDVIRQMGITLPPTQRITDKTNKKDLTGALVLTPSAGMASNWISRFADPETATASGWMMVRGNRRRQSVDRGFVLSDHADWNALNAVIGELHPEKIFVTHGFTDLFARWLREQGYDADVVRTEYSVENEEPAEEANG